MENIKTIIRQKDGLEWRKNSVRSHRERFFMPDEWTRFYDGLKDKQKITFSFLLNTGARINEIRNVRVEDCDLENKRLNLRVTKIRARKGEKNPKPRMIPISSQFSKYLKKVVEEYKLSSSDYFPVYKTAGANICMKRVLEKVGIADWYMFSCHNIRKTLEIWLMSLNVDGLKIVAHMGHSVNVAAQNYLSADIFNYKDKEKIRMIIGDLYSYNRQF